MGMTPPMPGGYGAGLAAAASPPPMRPPGPPPPTGVGAVPTGSADSTSTPRTSASAAIMALRELKQHLPSMAPAIDGFSAQIQSAIQAAGGAQGAAAKPPSVDASAIASMLSGAEGGAEGDSDG